MVQCSDCGKRYKTIKGFIQDDIKMKLICRRCKKDV